MTRFCSSHVDEGVEDPSKESEGPELWQPLLLAAPVNHEAAANVLHLAAASGILLQTHAKSFSWQRLAVALCSSFLFLSSMLHILREPHTKGFCCSIFLMQHLTAADLQL